MEHHETPRRHEFLGAILGGLAVANRSWVLNRGGRGALLALMTFAPNIPTSEMTFGPELTHRQATKLPNRKDLKAPVAEDELEWCWSKSQKRKRHIIPQRWLCRSEDHRPFAYARGHDYIRRSDDTLWAHLSDGVLVSARSGEPLAYQVGSTFYDYQTRQPVYYEPS
jgi:hypothetical protein